ncbi:hypothetical protein SCLCIDRAFT_32268 [Scleroderma citrinum Foug A]|uniref:Dynamin N-terminal domain-containing protein n=1 Tax=Scleroderma citrinum Foug A TaxID=1036808 RepID=A0A0C2YTC9_9AGAM|nr:hypothetical protein SCLCIDRAFT_32268 [Scleroderma citrinum Foug A]
MTSASSYRSTSTSTSPTPRYSEEGVGLCDPITAQHCRSLLDLVNRLRNTGLAASACTSGKSLIESISGVTLPRSSGTCTRHAISLLRATTNKILAVIPWTCSVKPRFIADRYGAQIKPHVITFGDPVTSDKSDVEERIRRAQRAILNPSMGPKTFLECVHVWENETSFSRNYVSLEISGKELADFSFVDLPGLVAGVGQAGHAHDIDPVKSLVTLYIKKPSCMILLTVACETDFEKQGATTWGSNSIQGMRTVGKPLELRAYIEILSEKRNLGFASFAMRSNHFSATGFA